MGSSAKWKAKEKLEFCGLLHGARNIENIGGDYFSFECKSKMILKSGTILCKILQFGFCAIDKNPNSKQICCNEILIKVGFYSIFFFILKGEKVK